MRKFIGILIFALLAVGAIAQGLSTYGGESYSGAGGGVSPGAKAVAYVAVNGAYPAMTFHSTQGFDHALVVHLPFANSVAVYNSSLKSKHREKLMAEVAVNDKDVIRVRMFAFDGTDTTLANKVTVFDDNISVSQSGGIEINGLLAGWGETPQFRYEVNMGYDTTPTLSARLVGKEMFSKGVNMTALATATTATVHDSLVTLPWSARGFKGDSLYVDVDFGAMGSFEYGMEIGANLTGTMKHAVVKSSYGDPNAHATLYAEYVAHGADVYEYDGASRDIKHVARAVDATLWDGAGIYSFTGATYRMIPSDLTMPYTTSPARYRMVYANLEDLLPSNSRLIDARYNVYQGYSGTAQGINDTLIAVLNENPGDTIWYKYDEAPYNWPNYGSVSLHGYAPLSWKYQLQGNDDTIDATNATTIRGRIGNVDRASVGQWDPPLEDRNDFFDWGNTWQFTSEQHPDETRAPSGYGGVTARWLDSTNDWYAWGVTNLVRRARLGGTNNGWVMTMSRNTEVANLFQYGGQQHTTYASRPFLTMSYIDGLPEETLFDDNASIALSWGSDDGHLTSNDGWSAVSDSLGAPFTAYINIQESAGYYLSGDLVRWRSRGVEIGNHSRTHPLGTTAYCVGDALAWENWYADQNMPPGYDCGDWLPPIREWPVGIFNKAESSMDSLIVEFDPCWITLYMGLEYLDDPYVGKTVALPNNRYNMPGLYMLNWLGMKSMRGNAGGPTNRSMNSAPGYDWHTWASADPLGCSSEGNAVADSIRATWVMHNPWQPINVMGFAPTINVSSIVGEGNTPVFTEEQIKARTRYQIMRHHGRKQPVITWFVHASKGTSAYGSDTGKLGIQEWRWIAEECNRLGVPVLRARDVADWKWENSIAVDTPSTWGYYSEAPAVGRDPYRWTAEDEIFRRPTWLHANLVYGGIPYRGSGTSWTP